MATKRSSSIELNRLGNPDTPLVVEPDSNARRESEVERVYQRLRSWLVEAELVPGEFLSEQTLAIRCQTSRTPVREAFSRLAQDGWLTRIPRKGYLVAPISVRDIVELYEYRKVLECFTAETVARSASREQIAELAAVVKIERDSGAKPPDVLAASEAFHLRLAELAANQRVLNQLRLVLSYVRRLDTLCTRRVPGWIGHGEILSALRQGKPSAAAQVMARHIDLSRDKMLRLFGT